MRTVVALLLLGVALLGGLGLWNALDSEPERDRPRAEQPATPPPPAPVVVRQAHAEPEREEPVPDPGAQRRRRSAELRVLNEQGIDRLDSGDYGGAVELFERCHRERPENETYAFNLSEALSRLALDRYQEGERELALSDLERATRVAPQRDDLAQLLARWLATAAAEDELWQYETDHFELAFDGRRNDLLYGAQDVLDVLEAAYLEFAAIFGLEPVAAGRPRIRVVITDRPEFERTTGLGEWAGGAYDGTIRLPLDDLDANRERWARVLRHELGHVWLREVGGRGVPGWLNEGFCQWLEGERAQLLAAARRQLEGHERFTLEQLTGSLIHWDDAAEVGRAYAQAVLFLDSLARTYGLEAVLAMVRGCREGLDPGVRFESETRVSLEVAFEDFLATLPP